MKFGPHDGLEDERKHLLGWLCHAAFGRIAATKDFIGRQIHKLGTLHHLLGKK